ncbi:nucleotidyltransferase family protein [Glycomyces buryatensis]|uniref:Nucleotidyltransferase family protein n=1 Tax=Glycomyces buryatensis TaxID=2570927 RepID=A0A4S8Q0M3_9ACTN|nr:nucleotidyltransferase family protein [Glycomyces buryatensis]THV37613.1 hypothetical protein FAB82_20260 [Glycomyces buryatensis]
MARPLRVSDEDQSWELLKSIAIGRQGSAAWADAEDRIRSGGFNHDALIGQAVQHTLMETTAAFVEALDERPVLPNRTLNHLEHCLSANRVATVKCLDDAAEAGNAMSQEGVRFAFTKGIICQQTFYDGLGARRFNDIDMMVHPDDAKEAATVLTGLAYVERHYFDNRTQSLVPISKHRQAMYRLSPDHLPHFTRLNPGSLPSHTAVDVALSLTWHGSPWQVGVGDALDEVQVVGCRIPGGSVDLLALPQEYDLIFHVLHLFREGWFERTVIEKDVRLSQFTDVVRGWGALEPAARERFVNLIRSSGIELPVAWVLCHADAVFGSTMADECGLASYGTWEWMSSMAGRGGYLRWDGDMEQRLRKSTTVSRTRSEKPEILNATSGR